MLDCHLPAVLHLVFMHSRPLHLDSAGCLGFPGTPASWCAAFPSAQDLCRQSSGAMPMCCASAMRPCRSVGKSFCMHKSHVCCPEMTSGCQPVLKCRARARCDGGLHPRCDTGACIQSSYSSCLTIFHQLRCGVADCVQQTTAAQLPMSRKACLAGALLAGQRPQQRLADSMQSCTDHIHSPERWRP